MRTCTYILCCLLVCLKLISCQERNTAGETGRINELYHQISKSRYNEKDSLNLLVTQLDSAAKGKGPVPGAMALIGKGLYFSRLASYRQALSAFQEANRLLININADSLKGRCYAGAGNCYKNMSEYPAAIENFQHALEWYSKTKNPEYIAGIHSEFGQVYQLKGDLDRARHHLRIALSLLADNKHSPAYLNTAHTMANVYGMSNLLDSALLLDREGLDIALKMKLPVLQSPFLDNIANCYFYSGQTDSAAWYFKKAMAIDSASGNKKQISDGFANLGYMESVKGSFRQAESYYRKSLDFAHAAGYKQGVRKAMDYLALLYAKHGMFDRALAAREQYIAVNDSIRNEKTEARLAELTTLYETKKKEQQLAVQAATLSSQRMFIVVIGATAIIALIAVTAYYRRKKLKKEIELSERLEQQQREGAMSILMAEEKERQRIAADLHDGIGQMMTAAWLNLQALGKTAGEKTPEEAILVQRTTGLVGDSCAEIRQVSHNMTSGPLERNGLVAAIQDLTRQFEGTGIAVHFQAEEQPIYMEPAHQALLYRVVQECVNNVIRHARASVLDISLANDGEGLDILIEDNGIGIPEKEPSLKLGLGMKNIKSRIHYLHGTVEWDNTGNGTVVAIHIPLSHG